MWIIQAESKLSGSGAYAIFAQPDHASALVRLEQTVNGLRPRFA